MPDDIQSLLLDVAAHRIILKGGHRHQQIAAAQDVLRDVLKQTPIPEPERRER
ncbi:hypothetical protein [Sulfobacillus thermotolerans]|uniref:hypothetical protein n=1 Tax=Sulfobacillus thermotolerans TaxID=338644 RepID=UPI003367A264